MSSVNNMDIYELRRIIVKKQKVVERLKKKLIAHNLVDEVYDLE